METRDEVTCANTSAIFKNAWWQYRNYLKKMYFTGKETHQIPLCSPETHLLDDDWERLVLNWSQTKNVVRSMSSFSILSIIFLRLLYSVHVEQVPKPEEQMF